VRELVTLLATITFLPIIVSAQYGTAPNNYYPHNYGGSIFTGVVTETGDNQITLTFTKGSKTDTFTGLFENRVFRSCEGWPPHDTRRYSEGNSNDDFFQCEDEEG